MVVADDYRFLVAEYAIKKLEHRIRMWGLPWPLNRGRALEVLKEASRRLKRVRYSFLPASELVSNDDLKYVSSSARELAGIILNPNPPRLDSKQKFALAEIRWGLAVLAGLPQRFLLGDANHPEYAVDVVGVEITRVEPLEGTDRLKVTRASTGNIVFTIVTNIQDIRVGEIRAAALLPPVEFHGVISEAMYSSDPIDRKYVGKRVPRKLLHGDVAAQVIRLVNKR